MRCGVLGNARSWQPIYITPDSVDADFYRTHTAAWCEPYSVRVQMMRCFFAGCFQRESARTSKGIHSLSFDLSSDEITR